MILAVDVGNSFAKWKAWRDGECISKGKFEHGSGITDMVISLAGKTPEQIIYADVCDSGFDQQLKAAYPHAKLRQIRATRECLGVKNGYQQPERLGIDRWLAMIEVFHLAGSRACCVLDFGTAATLDVVNAEGQHQGGHIVPGLRMLRSTLPKYTGKVRFEAENSLELGYGLSTVEAVERGSLSMLVAWARAEIERFNQRYPQGVVFITGGTATEIKRYLPEDVVLHEDIVLDALRRIATS